ncbi:MAG: tRNA pseudouridine(38-40) synthase TruA [Candidatus Methylomirabilia bacterium]
MRYRLTIEYQGTRYHGWQGQLNARTVQGDLLRAARDLCGAPVDVQGSGRTDAGVHAIGQVAHLETIKALPADQLVHGLNDRLPQDINVLDARPAADRFHARHHAVGRSYLYQISRRRTAFGKPFVWWVKDSLDLGAMQRAAAGLAGMRDFAGFTDKRIEKDTSTLVLVREAVLAEAGDLILVRLRASHFLWKMVRRVVGCLVGVGRGEISSKDFGGLFVGSSPYPARVTAPPSGLFLEEVIFPGEQFQRPLEPVLGVWNPREIPTTTALPTVTSTLPLRPKHRYPPEDAAGRRGGAKGRSPAAERSEAEGGPQRLDPAARTGTAGRSKYSTARGRRGV